MSSGVMIEALKIFLAGISGFLIASFTVRAQRQRKHVMFTHSMMPLIRGSTPGLFLRVDRSLLTGKENDKGQEEDLNNAFGYTIKFKNIGNKEIGEFIVSIVFDEKANIVYSETNPPSSLGYEIKSEIFEESRNTIHFTAPYLNENQVLSFQLTTVSNSDPSSIDIQTKSQGIVVEKQNEFKTVGCVFLTLISLFILFYFYNSDITCFFGWCADELFDYLGGNIEEVSIKRVSWPVEYKIFGTFLGAFFTIVFGLAAWKSSKKQSF